MLALLLSGIQAYAVKASNKVIEYRQPDGTVIRIKLHGDEFHHWATDEKETTTLILDKDLFYRAGQKTMAPSGSRLQKSSISPRSNAAANTVEKTSGDHRFLVILVEFADLKFTLDNPKQAFENLLNQSGYSAYGATGSVFDYYYENSGGQFNPTFDVVGPFAVSGGYAQYGGNDYYGDDVNPDGAFHEACKLADSSVDFSIYDQDKDGYVDNIFFYYAGHNEAEGASANTIWPHKWEFFYYSDKFDGVRLGDYACSSEYKGYYGNQMCGIGTFCHEFGHVLGLPDFYDTDYESNGRCYPIEEFSLMDNGSYNNDGRTPPYLSAIERNLLGWMDEPQEITASGNYALKDISNNVAYKTSTSNPGEYFLYETRGGSSWDKYIPSGMIVYHVDQSSNIVHGISAKNRWAGWNGINCYSDHPCYYIVKAKSYSYDSYSIPFPGSGNVKSFCGKSWAGEEMDISLNNISYSNGTTTFLLSSSAVKIVTGKLSDIWGDPVSGASVTIGKVGQGAITSVTTGSDGTYYADLTGVEDTRFSIHIDCSGFLSQSADVTVVKNTVVRDFILYTEWDGADSELHKYGSGDISGFGWGRSLSIMGAVKYTAGDLGENIGSAIGSISFYINDSSADAVYVLVEYGNERVMTMQVQDVVFNGWNTVPVSGSALIIPKDKDVWVGFAVVNPKEGKPLGIDAGPWTEGGGYLARYTNSKAAWSKLNSGNLLLGISLSTGINEIRANGYTYLKASEDGGYVIVPGRGLAVKTVEYSRTESLVSAEVTYTDGTSETIELEL